MSNLEERLDEILGEYKKGILDLYLGGVISKPKTEAKQAILALIDEARVDELNNLLASFDTEFSYYEGGKPYSEATGTVAHASRIKKVVDDRIAQLTKSETKE